MVGQAGDHEAHPAEIEHCVRVGDRRRQDGARLSGRQGDVGDEHDERQVRIERQTPDHRPPLDCRRGNQASEGGGGGVIGVAVQPDRHRHRVSGPGCGRGCHGQGGGRPETPADRDLRGHIDGEPVVAGDFGSYHRGQVGGIGRQVGALARRRDGEPLGWLNRDLDIEAEGERKHVKARAKVGR